MGLLDNALSALYGAGSGSGGLQQLAPVLENLLQQHGGLSVDIEQQRHYSLAAEAGGLIVVRIDWLFVGAPSGTRSVPIAGRAEPQTELSRIAKLNRVQLEARDRPA